MSSSKERRGSSGKSKPSKSSRGSSSGKQPESEPPAELEHRNSWNLSAEALYDYVNDSATALARVVAAQRDKLVGGASGANSGNASSKGGKDERPRKLSVHTTIRNRKSGQRVRFVSEVEVHKLPQREASDAEGARRGPWGEAPSSDEVWDGESRTMRPRELTQAELQHIIDSQRAHNMKGFWDSIKPLFSGRKPAARRAAESDSDSDSSSSEDDLDLVVEIELVDEEEAEHERRLEQKEAKAAGKPGARESLPRDRRGSVDREGRGSVDREGRGSVDERRASVEREKRASIERMLSADKRGSVGRASSIDKRSSVDRAAFGKDVTRVYGAGAGEKRNFTFAAPSERVEGLRRHKTTLLRQSEPAAKLSGSQASAAASAGKVLLMRAKSGKAFGAAVKRKVQLRSQREASLTRPKSADEYYQGDISKRRSKRRGKPAPRPSLRTPGTGLSLRPRYIIIYLLLPLFLIGVDDAYPVLERTWKVLRNPGAVRYESPDDVSVPLWLRFLSPGLTPGSQRLKDTVQVGAFVVEVGGLLVLLQIVQQLVTLFRAGRTIMKVHVEDEMDGDLDDEDDSEASSGDMDAAAKNYGFLFKWQPQK